MTEISRRDCEQLDRNDLLAEHRNAFALAPGLIYLDGNSLGAMPKAAALRAREVVEQEWGRDLIASWNQNDWFELPLTLGNKIAQLIGAAAGEVVVTDSTGINLYKVLSVALSLQATRQVILMEGSNFPSDNYVSSGLVAQLGDRHRIRFVEEDELMAALDDEVAVLCLTQVHYKTGRMLDMQAVTAAAQARGIVVVWDLSHSTGAFKVDLNGCNVDFAVGCTYKYLNGGPGSPAYVFAAQRHHGVALQPLTGWWGHDDPFAFLRDYVPAAGISQMLSGTQPIVSLAMVEPGLDLLLKVEMPALREKSLALGDLFIELLENRCRDFGFSLVSPRERARRGSQVAFDHEQGYAIIQALIERRVVGDFRAPSTLRFGLAPLYLRHIDIWDAVQHLLEIMQSELWREPRFHQRARVT